MKDLIGALRYTDTGDLPSQEVEQDLGVPVFLQVLKLDHL